MRLNLWKILPQLKQPKYITVKLPCKPYIRKFVEALYGNPVRADHSTNLGCIINLTLEKTIYENRQFRNPVHKDIRDSISVLINHWQFQRLGFDFSNENILVINRILENSFEESLYQFVRNHVKEGVRFKGYKEAIEQFADSYGIEIEEDISYEGLKKKEARFRNKVDSRKENYSLFQ